MSLYTDDELVEQSARRAEKRARGLGPGLKTQPPPGTPVRLTGVFLRSTGQITGDDGRKRWTVQKCECSLCKSGSFVATDEKHPDWYMQRLYSADEIATMPHLRFRHFAIGNLEIVGAKPKAADYP